MYCAERVAGAVQRMPLKTSAPGIKERSVPGGSLPVGGLRDCSARRALYSDGRVFGSAVEDGERLNSVSGALGYVGRGHGSDDGYALRNCAGEMTHGKRSVRVALGAYIDPAIVGGRAGDVGGGGGAAESPTTIARVMLTN